jgi:hypothetical protein
MALEKTFREFSVQLTRLQDRLDELRLTVVEDRPSRNDAVVVDNVELALEDMAGWLHETRLAAKVAGKAVAPPIDLDKARQALSMCQEKFPRIERVFSENLLLYERVKDLTSFGSERRGEWLSWVTSVKQGIDHCRQPIENAGQALAACWQEIAERVGMTSVSVRTTNIGQKIASRPACSGDVAGERLT